MNLQTINILQSILDIIFPKKCVLCRKHDTFLCSDCKKQIKYKKTQKCINCGKINNCGKLCYECKKLFYFEYAITATKFNNKDIKKIITLLKYKFVKDIGKDIGLILAVFFEKLKNEVKELENFINTKPLIIPVPLHKKRIKWRGFNQAEIISKHFAPKFNLSINTNLIRLQYTDPQVNLNKSERLKNVKNIFKYTGNLNKKNIILIDDVITTGSTAKYASKALKQANAGNIMVLTIAGT